MKIEQILLTTDFSENARHAYPCAASLARKFGADVHLVYFAGAYPPVVAETAREAYFEAFERALQNEAELPAFANVEVVTHFKRHRWTPQALRALEQEQGVDMVVMGTHGRTGVQHFVLGSFAERVVRNSSVPVLVYRGLEKQTEFEPKEVVVPYDFSEASEAILPAVRFLGSYFPCHFRFVYVFEPEPPQHFPVVEAVREFLRLGHKKPIEDRFAELASKHFSKVTATLQTCQGVPSEEIARRVRELQADLVLIGTHGVLGSVAQNVTRESPCSVLTVPSPGSHLG